MTTTHDLTDEELLLDLVAVHRESGHLSYSLYAELGAYNVRTIVHRFGSFGKACAIINIAPGKDAAKHEPKVIRTCIGCDVPFASPKDDPSCRRCPRCKRNQHAWGREVAGGWEKVAG